MSSNANANANAAGDSSTTTIPHVRLMCSFNGRIIPRPGDHQLRYVGGETRMVSIPRTTNFASLLALLSKLTPSLFTPKPPLLKYQLPHEDLDALISLTSDDDLENMFDEIDRLNHHHNNNNNNNNSKSHRLRLFLFPRNNSSISSSSAFGSVLSAGGTAADRNSSEQWFVDALNSTTPTPSNMSMIERGRSEVSSVLSEMPDYLFGFDNASAVSDETGRSPVKSKSEPEEIIHDDSANVVGVVNDIGNLMVPASSYVPENAAALWNYQPVYYVPVQYLQSLDPAAAVQGFVPGAAPVYASAATAGGGIYGYELPATGLPMMYPPMPSAALYPSHANPPVATVPLAATEVTDKLPEAAAVAVAGQDVMPGKVSQQ